MQSPVVHDNGVSYGFIKQSNFYRRTRFILLLISQW